MPPLDLRTQRAVTVSAAFGRHRYDVDPSTAIAEARAAAGGDAEVLAEEAGRWADFYGAPAGRGARDGGLREALSRSRALRSNAEVRRMAGRTRDLAGAAFGDPWQARTRQGLPVKPPTWRIVASFADGGRLVVERRGATDAEPFERIDALRKRPFGARAGTRWTLQEVWDDWWTTTSEASEASRRTLPDGSISRSPLTWQDSTRVRYRSIWRNHVAEKWSHRDPASITRAEIYEWLREPHACQPKALLDCLRVICRHADNRGIAPSDPTRGGFQLTSVKPAPRPLTSEQLNLIEDHLRTLKAVPRQPDAMRLHDGWVILRASGARISELLSLQVGDFDPSTSTLAIGLRHLAKVTTPSGRSTITLVEGTKRPRTSSSQIRRVDGSPRTAFPTPSFARCGSSESSPLRTICATPFRRRSHERWWSAAGYRPVFSPPPATLTGSKRCSTLPH